MTQTSNNIPSSVYVPVYKFQVFKRYLLIKNLCRSGYAFKYFGKVGGKAGIEFLYHTADFCIFHIGKRA
ncbi:MAG: hypothetical protein A2W86_08570 [Bacteroidetes bacterium GWD2_45_23]|nr:MAG: hypothetical protein A2W87_10010 [Bacteroidetes bacterium GWC2_46_850]OFX71748.1 MAG: hypothetical protein A2071_08410 [Bacteroidetes bacterium GWC1_47_7]OFX87001.1 MAG: hypothetical protein A2W86_08570 [Bacteroidetes bacterium GWD2_45_23]